jgi:hypothetical protein
MKELYRIWSVEHQAWWGANSRGYVTAFKNAGLYTDAESKGICVDANKAYLEEFRVPSNIKASLAFMKKVTYILEGPHELGPDEIKMASIITEANKGMLPMRSR